MIQKKSFKMEYSRLPPPSASKREQIVDRVQKLKNHFEDSGTHTVKRRAFDKTYSQSSFNVKHNFYGAKLNTSEL